MVAPTGDDVDRATPAGDRSFPRREDLPLLTRLGVQAAATADVALRTAAAAVVSTTIAPHALSVGLARRDAARLAFYRDLADAGSARDVFPAPAGTPQVDVAASRDLPRGWLPGRLRSLRFDSGFVPLNPRMRVPYLELDHNRTAWAQHWVHADGPRPTLIVVHGFMASTYWLNRAMFQLPWFYSHGYDILLVTLPFHGRRRQAPWHYSGQGLFADGFSHFTEAVAQGLHDLRGWVDHLLEAGVPRVGITGLSLGGYMSALLATVEDRLEFVIPNVPVTDVAEIQRTWVPMGWVVDMTVRRAAVPRDHLQPALALTSPLTWPCLVPHDRRFIIAGLGDRLAPPDHAERLWEHWDRPRVHWFPGNHVLHVQRGGYLREMGRFLNTVRFGG